MKFLRCYIAAFGGLKEKTLEFPAGLCEFCEPNGSGKSTLASFLKAVFYGLSGERKRNLSENERELYTPWEGGNFGGFLEFEAGGKRYRAERFFSPESFLLTDLETGRESLDYGKNLGEELFGLDADSFLGSILMPAKSAGVGATAGLTAKLNDLSGEVFDICAYEGAIRSLEDARKSIALYRGKGGSLYRETERTRMIEENLRNAHAAEEAAAREEEEAGHALHRRQVAEEALNAAEKSLTAQKEAADAVRRGEELKKMLTTLSEREHEKETLLASCPAALLPADGLANLETATVREEQARSAVAEAETRFCILRAARPEGLPGEEDRKKLLKAEEDIEFLQTKLCTLQEEPEPQRPGTRYLFFLLAALFAAGAAAITGIALSPLFFLLFLPAAALLIPLFSALRTNREATQKAKTRAALLKKQTGCFCWRKKNGATYNFPCAFREKISKTRCKKPIVKPPGCKPPGTIWPGQRTRWQPPGKRAGSSSRMLGFRRTKTRARPFSGYAKCAPPSPGWIPRLQTAVPRPIASAQACRKTHGRMMKAGALCRMMKAGAWNGPP